MLSWRGTMGYGLTSQSIHPFESQIDLPPDSQNRYSILQQEVALGVRALTCEHAELAVTMFQSALEKLNVDQPFYDHLVYNLLSSYSLLIEKLLRNGDRSSAYDFVKAALRLEIAGNMAADSTFLCKFAGCFQNLGIVLLNSGLGEASVWCCRKALSIHCSPASYVNLTNSLAAAGQRARLSDFSTDITPDQLGRHLFIACLPKSASTFLKNLLISVTGYRDLFAVYAAGQNEHDIYLPTLKEFAHLDTVTQQHCRASDANVHLMQAFGIRPVVLVRNIFDSVISLFDFYNGGAFKNSYFSADWQSLNKEMKIDLLIDNVIPWYFQFFSSWELVEKRKRLELRWLTYEDLIGDKASSVLEILEFYGLGASRRGLEQRITEIQAEQRKIRFNRGVTGRGKLQLNDRQTEKIRRLASFYPSTDFGRMGL